MTTGQGIFNMTEAEGVERVQHETTAAQARVEAPNSEVARQIDQNAEQEKDVARQAALAAESIGLGKGSPGDELRQKTNEAVQQGQNDATTYLEQAKNVASSVASTVQSYLPSQETVSNQAQSAATATKDLTNSVADAAQKFASGDRS